MINQISEFDERKDGTNKLMYKPELINDLFD